MVLRVLNGAGIFDDRFASPGVWTGELPVGLANTNLASVNNESKRRVLPLSRKLTTRRRWFDTDVRQKRKPHIVYYQVCSVYYANVYDAKSVDR